MSARSGLVGKKSSRPYLGPSEAIFSIGRKNQKNVKILPIFLGGPMGPYSPGLGPCCYPPEVMTAVNHTVPDLTFYIGTHPRQGNIYKQLRQSSSASWISSQVVVAGVVRF